ncbi:hypothetical protein LTR27_002529 [Elasticomyces elasticus]|nr:hypothetical protein LTR27_002529 [Elasticomyces elasticus]
MAAENGYALCLTSPQQHSFVRNQLPFSLCKILTRVSYAHDTAKMNAYTMDTQFLSHAKNSTKSSTPKTFFDKHHDASAVE